MTLDAFGEGTLMFRARAPQRQIFSARNQYLDLIDSESFYGLLARHGEELFSDYDFEDLYDKGNGRPCIPPGQMFVLMLLQMYENCSDYKAIENSRFDIRWLVPLDLQIGERLCSRIALVEFRARLHLNSKAEEKFKGLLVSARRLGILKGDDLEVAIDTTPILGRGAVKDTYNLIADGIRKLAGVLARLADVSSEQWAKSHDLARYWDASSLKGEAEIDWSKESERRVFLNGLVADAARLLLEAEKRAKAASEEDAAKIQDASALLKRLIVQDTEPVSNDDSKKPNKRKKGKKTSTIEPSANTDQILPDKESQHASAEPALTTTPPSGTLSPIADSRVSEPTNPVEHASGRAEPTTSLANPTDTSPSGVGEPENIEQPETVPQSTEGAAQPSAADQLDEAFRGLLGQMLQIRQGVAPDRIISVHDEELRHGRKSASNLFDGYKQQVCVDTDSKLILSVEIIPGNAPDNQEALGLVKRAASNAGIPIKKALADCAFGDGATRQAFHDGGIDLSAKVPSPPANDPFNKGRFVLDLTSMIATCPAGQTTDDFDYHKHRHGVTPRFRFSAETCQACPYKDECLRSADQGRNRGRTIALHPQEELLQKARRRQEDPAFREEIAARQVVEHRQARTVQLGGRQARYRGLKKVKFQSIMIAMVANLTLMAGAIFFAPIWAAVSSALRLSANLDCRFLHPKVAPSTAVRFLARTKIGGLQLAS